MGAHSTASHHSELVREILFGPSSAGSLQRPHLADWQVVLQELSIGTEKAYHVAALAHENGTSFAVELIASGAAVESDLYRTLAVTAGLCFIARLDPDRLSMRACDRLTALGIHGGWPAAIYFSPSGQSLLLIAPRDADPAKLSRLAAERPALAQRIAIVAPGELRRAITLASREELKRQAVWGLFDRFPHFSARQVATARQGALAGTIVATLPLVIIQHGGPAMIALHVFFSVFFLCCVMLRLCALNAAEPPRLPRLGPVDTASMPVYTVCVALYREVRIIPQLLLALGKLQWPRSKLQIKLICEADDDATLAALRAHQLHPCIEIVEVPGGGPRTKPNALAHALPLCGGEFLALYDAEDRPHPLQLIEAWQRFEQGDARLACVQAPLWVTNEQTGLIARMFAFEYCGLFRAMLPWLSQSRLMFPLGGTSNHFRMSALRDAGGWDPFNVTEDADLGLRLHRLGYVSETISYPTFEDGPETLRQWLPQRARWFKGWLHTWLVHMRHPVRLARDLGPASFLVSQILFVGLLVSALVHPVFLATVLFIGARMLVAGPTGATESALFIIDAVNISLGYGAFIALGALTLTRTEKRPLWKVIAFTPVYWLMLSWAAWWAVLEILRRPHHWNKTAHDLARNSLLTPRSGTAVARRNAQPTRQRLPASIR